MPTLLGAAGVEPPDGLAGVDLLAAPPPPDRALFHRTSSLAAPTYDARAGRWKLILPARGPAELYDLVADPGENEDLAAVHPEEVERLRRMLRRHLAESRRLGGEVHSVPIPEEDRRRLRSLGYL